MGKEGLDPIRGGFPISNYVVYRAGIAVGVGILYNSGDFPILYFVLLAIKTGKCALNHGVYRQSVVHTSTEFTRSNRETVCRIKCALNRGVYRQSVVHTSMGNGVPYHIRRLLEGLRMRNHLSATCSSQLPRWRRDG